MTRQDQAGTHNRLPKFMQQGAADDIVGYPQTNSLALWVDQSPGNFFSGLQDKGIGPGGRRLEQAVG